MYMERRVTVRNSVACRVRTRDQVPWRLRALSTTLRPLINSLSAPMAKGLESCAKGGRARMSPHNPGWGGALL